MLFTSKFNSQPKGATLLERQATPQRRQDFCQTRPGHMSFQDTVIWYNLGKLIPTFLYSGHFRSLLRLLFFRQSICEGRKSKGNPCCILFWCIYINDHTKKGNCSKLYQIFTLMSGCNQPFFLVSDKILLENYFV